MTRFRNLLFLLAACLLINSCTKKEHSLKVAASSVPHAEILSFIREDLREQGIDLQVIEVDDYNIPNRSLADKEIDANYFQHRRFLDAQIAQCNYCLIPLASIHLEPLGIYSYHYINLKELPEGSKIAIPNDPTNEARALELLQTLHMIELEAQADQNATLLNIKSNPHNLKISELDAAMLPRSLQDVDAALIPTNYALQAGLNPTKDALALENSTSEYVNILVVRCGDEHREDLQKLRRALTSQKVYNFIETRYHGAVIPAFHPSD